LNDPQEDAMTDLTRDQRHTPQPAEESPLTMPPARLREPSADDQDIDLADPTLDLPLDDSERLREDAETLKD
jgi:hypothetical protein